MWWVVGGGAAASGASPVFVALNEPVEIVGNSNNKKLTSRREICKVQAEIRSVQELFLQNISVPHTCKASLPSKPRNPKP